jgi:predicted phage terminase large subunit-like protein
MGKRTDDFIRSIDPVALAEELGFHSWPWQKDFLRSTHPRILMLCPRGAGKSILTALVALYHALNEDDAFILMFSKSERQSMELFKKTIDFYKQLREDLNVSTNAESAHRIELENGSRIISLPSSTETIVGYHDVTLLIIDEAALVKDELYQRARPMLHHEKGRLILMSTPFGRRGFFFKEWTEDFLQNPDTIWHGITVTTDDCPHMSKEFLAEERAKLGERIYRSEYENSFESDASAMFQSKWLKWYDPEDPTDMPQQFDLMIQSWDPTSTKTAQADFCVGQVWGKKGANMYLLDQRRGRWDFDEIVREIKAMSDNWPAAHAKIIEAQSIGAGLSAHLKNSEELAGVIPIAAVGKKEQRALEMTPYFQAGNVYLPLPESKPWMKDYLDELLNFPNVANDDCVDATTQALKRLVGQLYDASEVVADTGEAVIDERHTYRIGWIPSRGNEYGVFLIYNYDTKTVVRFERRKYASMSDQLDKVFFTAQKYGASVRAESGPDEALLKALSMRGASVRKIDLAKDDWTLAYENLSLLMSYKQITLPGDVELLAELEVFKSEARFDGKPDYSYQAGQNSAVRALCLVTFDVRPEIAKKVRDFGGFREDEVHSVFPPGWSSKPGKQIIYDNDFMY